MSRLNWSFALLLSSCCFGQQAQPPAAKSSAKPATRPAAAAPVAPKVTRPDGYYATLQTSMGDITFKFFENEAPVTVKNFVDLAQGRKSWPDPRTGQRVRRPLYNGTIFHRVIPNFMIQGGSPDAKKDAGSDPIKDEFVPSLKFDVPGRVAMANIGEPNTGSCQFFITEVATPHLNMKHAIFGQVVEGQDLVAKIARVPVKGTTPITPVVIKRVVIERFGAAPAAAPAKPKPAGAKPATAKPATAKPAAAPAKK